MPPRASSLLAGACAKGDIEDVGRHLFAYFYSNDDLEEAAEAAIEQDNVVILEILEDAGWDVNEYIAQEGLPELMVFPVPERFVHFLLQRGADPNLPQEHDILPVTEAAHSGPISVLTSLLEHKAILKNSSALLAAATCQEYDRLERIDLLLEHGACLDELAPRLPWHTNFSQTLPLQRETALHAACRWGFRDCEQYLLLLGADDEICDSLGTRALELKNQTLRLSLRWFPRIYVSDRAKARFAAARRKRWEFRVKKRQTKGTI